MHGDRPFVPEQRAQRHHIRLLDGLRSADPLRTEAHIDRRRAPLVCRRIDLFELEIVGKLLEEPGRRIEPRHQLPSHSTPGRGLALREPKSCRQQLPSAGLLAAEDGRGVGGSLQIEGRHHVRVGIVIDQFVVLVRADHLPDVRAAVRLDLRPARPEPRRFDEDLGACGHHEGIVADRAPILPNAVRNVGADVVLPFTRPDDHKASIGCDDPLRRYLVAGVGRFPGIKSTLTAVRSGLAPRSIEGVVAVHEQGPCRRRIGKHVERQHVDLGVPEHMAAIRLSGQPACTDRDMLVGRIDRCDEVVDRESKRALRLFVSDDPNIGGFPFAPPCIDVRFRAYSKAPRAHRAEMVARRVGWTCNVA